MNRPSEDQSSTNFVLFDLKSSSSFPEPLEDLQYRSNGPVRFDEKTTRLPSGDQTGLVSTAGSNVNRELLPVISISQISLPEIVGSDRATATLVSSGDRDGAMIRSAVPTVPSCLPVRSSHVSREFGRAPLL